MYVFDCIYTVHVSAGVYDKQSGGLNSLDLEFWATIWLLGIKLNSSAAVVLTAEPSLNPPTKQLYRVYYAIVKILIGIISVFYLILIIIIHA